MAYSAMSQVHIESGGNIFVTGTSNGVSNTTPELYSEIPVINYGTITNNGEIQYGDSVVNNGTYTSTGDDVFVAGTTPNNAVVGNFKGANDMYNVIVNAGSANFLFVHDTLEVDERLVFESGTVLSISDVYVKNSAVNAIQGASLSGGSDKYISGSLERDVSIATNYSMPVGDVNHGNQSFNILFNNTGGGNKISASYDDALAGSATKAACQDTNAFNVQSGTWTITSNGVNSNYDYDITLIPAGANTSLLAASLYDAFVKDGQFIGNPCANTLGNYSATGLISFSQFNIVGGNNAVLPITLKVFKVYKTASTDVIEWTTDAEVNNKLFSIERSLDGIEFTEIGVVQSKALNGNSNHTLDYRFIDQNPQQGYNYYRLKQVDFDEKSTLSNVKYVFWDDLKVVQVYPNPASEFIKIDWSSKNNSDLKVKLSDMRGRIIQHVQFKSKTGMNSLKLKTHDLPSGIYFVQVYENNRLIKSEKVRKQD